VCLSNNPAERALGGIALGPGRDAPGVGVRHQQHADEAQAVDAHFLAEQGYGEERDEERCGVTSAIAAAIAGCAIPLSPNGTVWMRWRCAAGIFHRSAVFSRRTSALLHFTIRSPESDGPSESHLKRGIQPVQAVSCLIRIDPIHAVMELV
jgi:hypothetical protein